MTRAELIRLSEGFSLITASDDERVLFLAGEQSRIMIFRDLVMDSVPVGWAVSHLMGGKGDFFSVWWFSVREAT